MGLCLAAGGLVVRLGMAALTLAWTHSVEKIAWEEDWAATPQGLVLREARVRGSGAGMEPPPEARFVEGGWRWTPDLPPLHEPHIAWWWLALGFLVGERCVVHLEFSRNAHSFSLGDVPLVFGLVLATGHDLVVAAVVGPALTLLLDRRLPPIKLFFNLGQFALSVCLATLICSWLAPVGTDWGPRLAIASITASGASRCGACLAAGVNSPARPRNAAGCAIVA